MIKIELYTAFDRSVLTIEATYSDETARDPSQPRWLNLHYSHHGRLEHSETDTLVEWVSEAIRSAEERAAGAGGWSALA